VIIILPAGSCRADEFEQGVEAFEKKDFDAAIASFNKSIATNLKSPAGYFYRGLAFREKKEYESAISDFTDAIRLEAKPAACYYNRGIVYSRKRNLTKALEDFNSAVRLEPENAIPYVGRGWAFEENKQYEKAIEDYMTAVRLAPKMSVGHNNLAWLRATCPNAKLRDGKKAVELATKACELTEWKAWLEVGTLAAAYAENGNFKEAVKWQNQAIELGADDKDFLEKARPRLKLYEKNEPYRQE